MISTRTTRRTRARGGRARWSASSFARAIVHRRVGAEGFRVFGYSSHTRTFFGPSRLEVFDAHADLFGPVETRGIRVTRGPFSRARTRTGRSRASRPDADADAHTATRRSGENGRERALRVIPSSRDRARRARTRTRRIPGDDADAVGH